MRITQTSWYIPTKLFLSFVTDSDHVVTVTSITDPPFKPGRNVVLHCSVNPDPSVGRPVRLYYRWRGNDGQFSHSSSSPNVLTVTEYKASYYYCEISVRGYAIGVGSILIETAGIQLSDTLS